MVMQFLGSPSRKDLLIQLLEGQLEDSLQLSVPLGIASATKSCLGKVTHVPGVLIKAVV